MKCPSCNEDLPVSEEFYAKMTVCPLCGSPISHEHSKPVKKQPQTVEEYLADMVEKEGVDIFNRSKMDLLYRYLSTWPSNLSYERDRFLLLCMENIPDALYRGRNGDDASQGEIIKNAEDILKSICDFEKTKKIFSLVQHLLFPRMNLQSNVGKDNNVSQIVTELEKEYKTVQIGNTLWMAENLRWGDFSKAPQQSVDDFKKYGGYYYKDVLGDVIRKFSPWRLPTKRDFENLIQIAGGGTKAAENLCASNKWPFFSRNRLGFDALPAGGFKNSQNYSQPGNFTAFWVKDNTIMMIYRGECLFLQAERNSAYSIRLVMDV